MRCAAPRRRHRGWRVASNQTDLSDLSDLSDEDFFFRASGRHEDAGSANAASDAEPLAVSADATRRRSASMSATVASTPPRVAAHHARSAAGTSSALSRATRSAGSARPASAARARRRRRHGLGDRVPRAPRTRQPGCAGRAAGCDATRIERVARARQVSDFVGTHFGQIEGSVFKNFAPEIARVMKGFSGAPPPHHRRHFDARRRSRRALERVSP